MFGYESGGCNTTGCYNIFLGHLTGKGSQQTTGNNNISLGLRAGRCISSGANNVFIGECVGADAVFNWCK